MILILVCCTYATAIFSLNLFYNIEYRLDKHPQKMQPKMDYKVTNANGI